MPQEISKPVQMSTSYATMFYCIAKEALNSFSEEGNRVLRQAIRDYGTFRAHWMRDYHRANGIPVNLINLTQRGDMPNDSLQDTVPVRKADAIHWLVETCTLFNTWNELDAVDIGRIYCDEVHNHLYGDYGEGITLEMPKYQTKRDEICEFILTFPGADPDADLPDDFIKARKSASLESRMARLTSILYVYLAGALIQAFGSRGKEAMVHALAEFGRISAERLKKRHIEEGIQLSPENLVKARQDYYADSIGGEWSRDDADAIHLTIHSCAFCSAFQEVEGNRMDVGRLYCETVHQSIAEHYLGSPHSLEVKSALAFGDSACSLVLS